MKHYGREVGQGSKHPFQTRSLLSAHRGPAETEIFGEVNFSTSPRMVETTEIAIEEK